MMSHEQYVRKARGTKQKSLGYYEESTAETEGACDSVIPAIVPIHLKVSKEMHQVWFGAFVLFETCFLASRPLFLTHFPSLWMRICVR